MIRYLLPLLLCLVESSAHALVAAQATAADQSSYEVKVWTVQDGLPELEVTALTTSADGRLWVGTHAGLARFDGRSFEPYQPAEYPQFTSRRIEALLEASDGALWIGTGSQGLVRLSGGRYTQWGQAEGLPSLRVNCLLEDRSGRIWAGTDKGLVWFEQDRVVPVSGTEHAIHALEEDAQGRLWMAATGLLAFLEGEQPRAIRSDDLFSSLAATASGELWIASLRGGPLRWKEGSFLPLDAPQPTSHHTLCSYAGESVWMAGAQGAQLFTQGKLQAALDRDDFFKALVTSSLVDGEGSLWLAGEGGLARVRRTPFKGISIKSSASSPRTLLIDRDGRMWVSFHNGSLGYFDGSPTEDSPLHLVTDAPGPLRPMGQAMLRLRDDSLLFASRTHLWKKEADGSEFQVIENDLPEGLRSALLEDATGQLWIGSEDAQLFRMGAAGSQQWGTEEGLPKGIIQALYEDPEGSIWVGSSGGVCYLEEGKVVRTWHTGEPALGSDGLSDGLHSVLPAGEVRAFLSAGPDAVWVGTNGGGLCHISKSGHVIRIGIEEGLFEEGISRIVDDGRGNLVLQGNHALSVIRRSGLEQLVAGRLKRVATRVFNSGAGIGLFEGMGGAMPMECRDERGVLWFPTLEGVASYSPEALTRIKQPPRVLIKRITSGDQEFLPGQEVTLAAGASDLHIEYAALTLVEPERALFRHRLEGHESSWHWADDSQVASYTNLAPGSYRFRVIAANRDGIWNEVGATTSIRVLSNLERALRYALLPALLLGGLVFLGFRRRTSRIQRRAEDLELKVKERTAELQEAQAQLEQKVAERTAQLGNALANLQSDVQKREQLESQLRQSQKFEAVGRLAGGLAHDFNNILTAVVGEAEVIKSGLKQPDSTKEQILESVESIQNSSQRAAKLTRQLLAYSRSQVMQPEVLAPGVIISKLSGMLRRLILQNIELVIEPEALHGFVRVDPGQLEQVIINLVINAKDAIQGPGRITLSTSRQVLEKTPAEGPGSYICISVSDTGVGIEDSVLEHLFDPFFSTKEEWQGSGLGLASVDGIVKQSGGQIRVQSKLGEGTRFDVYFPEVAAPAEAPDEPDRISAGPREECNVLICDDESSVLRVTAAMIENMGHKAKATSSPLEALELATDMGTPVQVLLTDLVMPEMNGIELATRMRRLLPNLRVLYISGFSSTVLAEKIKQDHDAGFLSKPYTHEQLSRSLDELLGQGAKD